MSEHTTDSYSTLCMRVIAETKEAVYLRLPDQLQQQITCQCEHCKRDPKLAKWDTLCVPKNGENAFSWLVHMPPPQVREFVEYVKRKEANAAARR